MYPTNSCEGHKKKKVAPKNIFSLSMPIKLLPLTEVSANKVQVYLMKFVTKEAQNSTLLPPF